MRLFAFTLDNWLTSVVGLKLASLRIPLVSLNGKAMAVFLDLAVGVGRILCLIVYGASTGLQNFTPRNYRLA